MSAKVTVNVATPNNININDTNGNLIQTYQAVSTFELPTLTREKTFVAYKSQDGKLYKQGETVEITEDVTFTLVEYDFSVVDTIEIRLSTIENRFGGLRFTEEPPVMRFFIGRLEPTSDWQDKLVAKFKEDFGDSL